MNRQNDTETLVESFCTLADEVQGLIDRKTILEHKLRFAAEQYQQLADKYAPAAPEISETLAKLQLPPDFHRPSISGTYVPLPKRGQTGCNQHQIALLIRDGRRAVQQLSLRNSAAKSVSNKDAASAVASSPLSTIMEQDFTVEGKKGMLQCPFSAMKREQQQQRQQEALQQLHLQRQQQQHKQQQQDQQQQDQQQQDQQPSAATQPGGSQIGSPGAKPADMVDSTPHNSADPICAAMVEEVKSQTAPSSAGAVKCPIRFMDQHSAEEIAHYVETHKHELPRSHAICLRRYNKNEEQIRKLDAKYGNLVNMISGLGQLHQPMLPSAEGEGTEQADRAELHRTSNERVENWAQTVSVIAAANEGPEQVDGDQDSYERRSRSRSRSGSRSSRDRTRTQSLENHDNAEADSDGGGDGGGAETERESHFDRPLKEVRLGESPSRPWGIAVPLSSLPNAEAGPPLSPPAAPVRMPSPQMAGRCPVSGHAPASGQPAKCPFGAAAGFPPPHGLGFEDGKMPAQPAEKGQISAPPKLQMPQMPQMPQIPQIPQMPQMPLPQMPQMPSMAQAAQAATAQMPSTASYQHGPAFVNFTPPTTASKTDTNAPQMLFTGPVFIGYSIEQAAQFMQYFQNLQK